MATKKRLPPEKGSEVFGILLGVLGLLVAASLVSYYPADPSLFQGSSEPAPIRNWIGPVGSELAALSFGLLGVGCLLLPLLLLVAAWRRLGGKGAPQVFGRGLGGLLLLGSLPGLLQLTLGELSWRGLDISAGGGFGVLAATNGSRALGFAGTLFVLLGAVVIGSALLVQSTLGELLGGWRERMLGWRGRLQLGWSQRRRVKHKEKSRARVVSKHLQRAAEKRRLAGGPTGGPSSGGAAVLDLPMRVTEKKGGAGFSVRKIKPHQVGAPNEPVIRQVPEVSERRVEAATSSQRRIAFPGKVKKSDLPPINFLEVEGVKSSIEENELVRLGDLVCARCAEFGVEGTIEGISPGPVITVYEFQPAPGVKVSQIVNLQDDLALALKAESVRIDRLPGRSTLGIEVPNKQRAVIRLGHLLAHESFRKLRSPLTVALGTTIHGEPYYSDLRTMPHLLVAGATGSGKSVGLQSMITSILYKARREEVQFIFIDPKRIELGVYRDIPHLKAEVVVEPKKAANALRWAVNEMERRYRLLAEAHVRSIDFYNEAIRNPEVQKRLALSDSESEHIEELRPDDLKPMPYYVIVIDELADLMMVSSSDVEASIARLAQMARAVGIHLIVATQRPSVDVLTGTIKANFPCRISYATASRHDSRTILDQVGSEKLLGRGDMLFMPPGTSRVSRLHGAYISEQETAALVRWLKKQGRPELDPQVVSPPEEERDSSGAGGVEDELFDEAARLVVAQGHASASFLQRRMRIGFSRAARLIDIMERDGLLGPPQGSKPREVLVKPDYFEELDGARALTEA